MVQRTDGMIFIVSHACSISVLQWMSSKISIESLLVLESIAGNIFPLVPDVIAIYKSEVDSC